MGQKFQSLFQLDTKRFLWLIVITFVVLLAFQYIELPYGNFLLSPFYTSKIPPSGSISFQIADPPSNSHTPYNVTTLNPSASFGEHAINLENDTDPNLRIALKPEHNPGSSYINSTTASFPAIAPVYQTFSVSPSMEVSKNLTLPAPELPKDNVIISSKNESLRPSQNGVNTMDKNSSTSVVPPLLKGNLTDSLQNENLKPFQNDVNKEDKNSGVPAKKVSPKKIPEVLSISEMSTLLLQSQASYRSMVGTLCEAISYIV